MLRVVVNSVLSSVELTAMDLLVLDSYASHFAIYAERMELNGSFGVEFNSDVVVGYYPTLESHKHSITARLRKLVSMNMLWEKQGVYGYGEKAKEVYGALEYEKKDLSIETSDEIIKRKKKHFADWMARVLDGGYKEKLEDRGWPKGNLGRDQFKIFYGYWTEKLTGENKLMWESKTAFDMERRFGTFLMNMKKNKDDTGYKEGVESMG